MPTNDHDPNKNNEIGRGDNTNGGSDDLPPVDKKVRLNEPPELSGDELLDLAMLHGGPD